MISKFFVFTMTILIWQDIGVMSALKVVMATLHPVWCFLTCVTDCLPTVPSVWLVPARPREPAKELAFVS